MWKIVRWLFLGAVGALVVVVLVARRTSSVVRVERTFQAPVERVWRLWEDPEQMKNWWSPKNFTAPVIHSDFRVDGKFLLSMRSSAGEMFWNTGVYREIIPYKKIVSTHSFSDESGRVVRGDEIPVPGVWPDEITVTVEFSSSDGKTTVSVEEIGIPLIMKVFAALGWEQQFDKIEALL